MEKFFNIKCRTSGLIPPPPPRWLLVSTRARLKMHGGLGRSSPQAAAQELTEENLV